MWVFPPKQIIIDINSNEFIETLQNTSLYQYIVAVKEIQNCFDNNGNLRECISGLISSGVLRNFLINNSNEVVNMLTFDFDKETYGEVKKEEGLEEGLEKGREEGREEERITNIKSCFANGVSLERLSEIFKMPEEKIKEIVE